MTDYYVYSGQVSNGITLYADSMYIFNGGMANYSDVCSGGHLYVSGGGTANATAVYSSGYLYVSSGGTANSTTVYSGGHLDVSNGGTANSTAVNNRGFLNVSNGGVANATAVYSSGYLYVSSGGVANETTVNSGGYLCVYSGGNAYDVTVSAYGRLGGFSWNEDRHWDEIENGSAVVADNIAIVGNQMYVSLGGVANATTVGSWGSMHVYDGTANETTVNSGYLYVSNGGVVNATTVSSRGTMYVSNGGAANYTTVSGWSAIMYVDSGGIAKSTAVERWGNLYVKSGGTALNVIWAPCVGCITMDDGAVVTFAGNYQGVYYGSANTLLSSATTMTGKKLYRGFDDFTMYVMNCGTANETTMSGGRLYVYSGGTVNSTTVNSSGHMYVYSGGTANETTVTSGGRMYVSRGGTAAAIKENGGYVDVADGANVTFVSNSLSGLVLSDCATLHSGTTANSTTVNRSGYMYIFSGGIASETTVTSGGCMYVSNGGVANRTTVNGNFVYAGIIFVDSGGVVNFTNVNSDGFMFVSNGGVANETTVNSGYLYVSNGGVANETTVNSGGYLYVSNGGVANETIVTNKGCLHVSSGGTVNSTTTIDNCWIYVREDGVANSTTVNSIGYLHVSNGGVANSTTVNEGGNLYVSKGGVTNATTVKYDGYLRVTNGGVTNSTSVIGGSMYVQNGGKITGTLNIAGGATVSAYAGSVIDFDLSAVSPGARARVYNWSLINGAPDCTVTVSAMQTAGTYNLAGGAADFNKTITVVTDTGAELGTVSVGGTLNYGGRSYTLAKSGSDLTLTVESAVQMLGGDDLNGDGRADIVMTITQAGHGAEGATGAWLIQRDQTAAWGDLSQRNPGWEVFGTGVTAAGKTTNDVYVKSADNIVGAWTTDATGKVAGWTTVGEFDGNTQVLGLGDFDGDGQSDLLLRNVNGAVGCHLTDGTGWNYFQSLGDEWKICAVGDLNGDGRDDVVLKHDAGFAGSWLTQTDCAMVWADLDTLPTGFSIVGAGDFNGDGTSDVLLKKGTYYGAWIVRNGNAAGWFGIGDLGTATVEQIADFDADGIDDLRIRTAAGDLGTQLVKGADTLEWKYYGSVGEEWSTLLAAI